MLHPLVLSGNQSTIELVLLAKYIIIPEQLIFLFTDQYFAMLLPTFLIANNPVMNNQFG